MFSFSIGRYAGTLISSILSSNGPNIFATELLVQMKMHSEKSNDEVFLREDLLASTATSHQQQPVSNVMPPPSRVPPAPSSYHSNNLGNSRTSSKPSSWNRTPVEAPQHDEEAESSSDEEEANEADPVIMPRITKRKL